MKRILVSQRVDVIESYNERRDAIDQRWNLFLREVGVLPIFAPNDAQTVIKLLQEIAPDGILLTGGDNPESYGGNIPERDEVDRLLIQYSESTYIPLLGVCRGMQSILLYFGADLKHVNGHIAVKHAVHGDINRTVNSYHSLQPNYVPTCFEVLARSKDESIEAIKHVNCKIHGIMWHPEREKEFVNEDVELCRCIWK